MSDKLELRHLPIQTGSIALSEARSSLIARGRKDAASLVAHKPVPKLPAAISSSEKPDSHDRGVARANLCAIALKLGLKHFRGEGIQQDYKQAAYWFRKAAELGLADAQYYLGLLYYNGQGVPRDAEQRAFWFRKAAEQGLPAAQYELGEMYLWG